MENPKLRIETDGRMTEIYIDGQKVEKAYMLELHAEPCEVYCEIGKYVCGTDGLPLLNDDKTDVKRTKEIVIDTTHKGDSE